MKDAAHPEDRLFEEALDLVIRLQNDPANAVSRETIQRWRARGPAYEAAWAEVAEIHGMAGKVLADGRAAARAPAVSRRGLIVAGLVVGAAAAGSAVVPGFIRDARGDYVTGTAEIRRVTLPDGSQATLGPDTAIALRFDETARRLELLAGMVFLDVAPEAARPFRATALDLSATALGTAFELSSDADLISVSVDRGAVEVRAPATEGRLDAGQWLTFDPQSRAIRRGLRERGQIGAWRDGQLFAEDEPVAAVVAKIARWQPGRVLIATPSLGASHVSGVFDLADPRRALEAAVHPFGARVRSVGRYLTVISPV